MLTLIIAAVDAPENSSLLEAIYRRYATELYRMAKRRLGDHYDAEEAVAEGFFRIARRFSTLQIDSPESDRTKGLVTIIVLNEAKRIGAKRGNRQETEEPLEEETLTEEMDPSGMSYAPSGAQIDDVSVWERILQAIRNLPERYRDIMLLYLVHEQKPRDISYLLELPGTTVRKRIERGRKILAEELADMRGGAGSE